MIRIGERKGPGWCLSFCREKESLAWEGEKEIQIGIGEKALDSIKRKEAFARGAKEIKKRRIKECSVDLSLFLEEAGKECIREAAEGLVLGLYRQRSFKKEEAEGAEINLFAACGLPEDAGKILQEALVLAEGIVFARDMVNLPGNKLRPMDFAREIMRLEEPAGVEAQLFTADQIRGMGMNGLAGIGDSSEYPPCFLVLRYLANPEESGITGLVGKGVTCDTGGYCLKAASSMPGIKGDMAGGAAVAGAVYALAKNKIRTNVIACIPMCENRISAGSLLPGDVITSLSGKTIEILNTDAEGRLILADAVSYAVNMEHVTRVLDIATLTGAVVNMLGFSVAGVISDNQEFFQRFRKAYQTSGERYWRLPFYQEHEKMIESQIADLKNMGADCCGTITAGLFIRAFAEGLPWLHVDIAGTAWVDTPVFEFQEKGATGAGVTTLYYLCK